MHRKESTTITTIGSIPANTSDPQASGSNTPESKCKDGELGSDDFKEIKTYPFAVVLRIRVLQVRLKVFYDEKTLENRNLIF